MPAASYRVAVSIRFVAVPSADTVSTYFAPSAAVATAASTPSATAITPCALVQSFVSLARSFVTEALSIGATNLVTSSASVLYSASPSAGS